MWMKMAVLLARSYCWHYIQRSAGQRALAVSMDGNVLLSIGSVGRLLESQALCFDDRLSTTWDPLLVLAGLSRVI